MRGLLSPFTRAQQRFLWCTIVQDRPNGGCTAAFRTAIDPPVSGATPGAPSTRVLPGVGACRALWSLYVSSCLFDWLGPDEVWKGPVVSRGVLGMFLPPLLGAG